MQDGGKTFRLEEGEINVIFLALVKLPYEVVAPIIVKLQQQLAAQADAD